MNVSFPSFGAGWVGGLLFVLAWLLTDPRFVVKAEQLRLYILRRLHNTGHRTDPSIDPDYRPDHPANAEPLGWPTDHPGGWPK